MNRQRLCFSIASNQRETEQHADCLAQFKRACSVRSIRHLLDTCQKKLLWNLIRIKESTEAKDMCRQSIVLLDLSKSYFPCRQNRFWVVRREAATALEQFKSIGVIHLKVLLKARSGFLYICPSLI